MKIWIVIRAGIYRNALVGVFSTLKKAKAAAEKAIKEEEDDWHYFEVIETEVDPAKVDYVSNDNSVAYLYRKMKTKKEGNKKVKMSEVERIWWE